MLNTLIECIDQLIVDQFANYLCQKLIENDFHVLTVGPTGTGKSNNAAELMLNRIKDNFNSVSMVLSARTEPHSI